MDAVLLQKIWLLMYCVFPCKICGIHMSFQAQRHALVRNEAANGLGHTVYVTAR